MAHSVTLAYQASYAHAPQRHMCQVTHIERVKLVAHGHIGLNSLQVVRLKDTATPTPGVLWGSDSCHMYLCVDA